MQIEKAALIHSLKIAIATTISAYIGLLVDAGHMFYIMITVVFVLQTEIGSSIKRSAQRVFGTILGAPIGVGVVLLIGEKHDMPLLLVSAISLAIVVLMIRKNYAVAITFLTVAMVIVYGVSEGSIFTETTRSRVLDTIYGTLIAIAVSLLVFPSSLSRALKKEWSSFLRESALFFQTSINECAKQNEFTALDVARKEYMSRCDTVVKKASDSAWELGLFGSSKINSSFKLDLLRVPMLLKNRALEMSVVTLQSIDMDDETKNSIYALSDSVKKQIFEYAQSFELGKPKHIGTHELYELLENTVESMGGAVFKSKQSDSEELEKLMEISTFYEQVRGIIDILHFLERADS